MARSPGAMKRQKELARMDSRKDKEEKRRQRKAEKAERAARGEDVSFVLAEPEELPNADASE